MPGQHPDWSTANAWDSLSLYESRDIVARLYVERHGLTLNADRAYGIVSHVAQAREYFSSASQAAQLVRPLLLYYGVLALTRAVILFTDRTAHEASLRQGHGLMVKDWGATLARGLEKIPDLEVQFTTGTFVDLGRVTRNVEESSVFAAPFPNRATITRAGTLDLPLLTVTLQQVLARVPDLSKLYETTFRERSASFPGFIFLLIGSGDVMNAADIMVFETESGLPGEDDLINTLNLQNVTQKHSAASHQFFGNVNHRFFEVSRENGGLSVEDLPMIKNDKQGNTFVSLPLGAIRISFRILATRSDGLLRRHASPVLSI